MVGLLPNCCRYVRRCLPRTLFQESIQLEMDAPISLSDYMTKEFHLLHFDRFQQSCIMANVPEDIFISIFYSLLNSLHTPETPHLECLNL